MYIGLQDSVVFRFIASDCGSYSCETRTGVIWRVEYPLKTYAETRQHGGQLNSSKHHSRDVTTWRRRHTGTGNELWRPRAQPMSDIDDERCNSDRTRDVLLITFGSSEVALFHLQQSYAPIVLNECM